MKTINLKGKDYALVSARLEQFHSDYKDGTITTESKFNDGYVIFTATVTFDNRNFTGHAFGKIGQEKAFEKIETTAVGRALAFAGYLAGGEIASYDEVKEFHEEQEEAPEMTVEDACHKLKVCTTIENLQAVWVGFPQAMRDEEEVTKVKDAKKAELE